MKDICKSLSVKFICMEILLTVVNQWLVKVIFPAESRAKAEAALTVSMDLKQPDQQQVQDIHTCG
jgi:hypothetical protein